MDVYCPKCSEPWDLDTLHEEVEERNGALADSLRRPYDVEIAEVRADFRRRGCEAFGSRHSDHVASPIVSEVLDLLGDDLDGAAALLEDAELLGIDF